MIALLHEYDQSDIAGESTFTLGSWLHYNFESIHQFGDGNGRVGRLMLNLHFLKHNWPPVNILPLDLERYLESLRKGHKGDPLPLTDYLKVIMSSSLLHFLSWVSTEQDELRPLLKLQGECVHSAKYLSLRARQGELPAVRIRKEWNTSKRALELYIRQVRRK
jgi:Fic family protein